MEQIDNKKWLELGIVILLKIARISTVIIPDGHKPSALYYCDTMMILESYWQ
jgi:hypothetical protein